MNYLIKLGAVMLFMVAMYGGVVGLVISKVGLVIPQ